MTGEATCPGPLDETEARPRSPTEPSSPEPRWRGTEPGGRLDGLVVEGELGRGTFGVVLRAHDPGLDRPVAVKLLVGALGHAYERFLREGQALAALRHPGIVAVHRAGVADGRPYLVLDLVEGARPLDQAGRGLPLAARVALVRDAARALGHAHARGVVHRDVKPANLLVDRDGRVRVADFGLVLAEEAERLTRTGMVLGTVAYMAPEQASAQRAAQGPPTDVWALGVVLYELLCDQRPFDADGFMATVMAITEATPVPPRARDPAIPAEVEAVVLRALSREPRERYPDGEALAGALDAALAARGAAPHRGLRLAAFGLACLAVAAAAGWWRAGAVRPSLDPPAPPATSAAPSTNVAASPRPPAATSDPLVRAALAGDAPASRELGLRCLGAGPTRDPLAGLTWLRRAADGGDDAGMAALVDALDRLGEPEREALLGAADGDPVVRAALLAARGRADDLPAALGLLAGAAEGSRAARLALAELAAAGRAPLVDALERLRRDAARPETLAWSERALELVHQLEERAAGVAPAGMPALVGSPRVARARELLAEGDLPGAERLLEEAARRGSSEAMYLLARQRVPERRGAALELLRRAAALSHFQACHAMGVLYVEGRTVPKDLDRGIALLRRAEVAAGPTAPPTDRLRLARALLERSAADAEGLRRVEELAAAGFEPAILDLAERLVAQGGPADLARAAALLDRSFGPREVVRVGEVRRALERARR